MSMEYDPVLYEVDQRPFLKEEVKFYEDLIRKLSPKTILELGVGTGRIFSKLLPLVKYGVGIDISRPMLSVCEKACWPNINYKLYEQSFVKFNLGDTFDLIYIPFNTFQHLLSKKNQVLCLNSIKAHMDKESHLILDLMNSENVLFDLNNWNQDYSSVLLSGMVIERDQKTVSVNKRTGVVHKTFLYKEIINGSVSKTHKFKALMKITPNEKIRDLLKLSGLEIKEVWSDYHFSRESDTKKMIYCIKRNEI